MVGKVLRRAWCLGLLVVLGSLPLSSVLANGGWLGNAPTVGWDSPSASVLKPVGVPSAGPINLSQTGNFDCAQLTYRLTDDITKTMHAGCFMSTAYGLFDYADQLIILNGSSEAEPIHANAGATSYLPLPFSASAAAIGGFPARSGSYFDIYKYFPNALDDRRDIALMRYKQVIAGPDIALSDKQGQAITVNPSALAYSSRGQWLVTESPGHGLLRVNLATMSILPFGGPVQSTSPNPEALGQAQLTVSNDGRYVAVANRASHTFIVYDLEHCSGGNTDDDLASRSCPSHDYWPYLQSSIGGLRAIAHVRFLNDSLLSFVAGTDDLASSYELTPNGQIASLLPYLALGDSYSSGEGAFDYLVGTDTTGNRCHLSSHAYPLLLSQDLFSAAGHSVACSGAVINDLMSESATYNGQSNDHLSVSDREADGSAASILSGFNPGYLPQQAFVRQYQPDVITVGIGGNDVGFAGILARCLSPVASLWPFAGNQTNCFTSYEDRLELEQTIDRTYLKWAALYTKLRQEAPASRIYAVGYPQIAAAGQCPLNVRLSSAEILFSQQLVTYLDGVIAKAARAAGIQYVDVRQAFAGHRLCEARNASLAMNGLTAGGDSLGFLGSESYHPTAYGQELLEQAILKATDNFTDVNPPADTAQLPPTPTPEDQLLDAPATGRPINIVVPDDRITADGAIKGSALTVKVSGVDDGLQPGSSYSIDLGNGAVLGTLNADSDGNLSGFLTVPLSVETGLQTLRIIGSNTSGDTLVITKVIYVDSSGNDYDGDGVPNQQDSCPTVTNGGTDRDQDGTDDACDPLVITADDDSPGSVNSGTSSPVNNDDASPPPAEGGGDYQSGTDTESGTQAGPTNSPGTSESNNPDGYSGSTIQISKGEGNNTPIVALGADNGTAYVEPPLKPGRKIIAAKLSVGLPAMVSIATIRSLQQSSSPQPTAAVLGAHTQLKPVSNNEPPKVLSDTGQLPPLKVIKWLPWTITTSLAILLLLAASRALRHPAPHRPAPDHRVLTRE